MRQRIWRRLFAAAVGVLTLAGLASAQPPAVVVPTGPLVAQPAPGPVLPTVPAAAAGVIVQPGPGAVIVPGNGAYVGGHPTAHRGFVMQVTGNYYLSACPYGEKCNNGCGSLKSDLGFVLGSCKSFFAPCGPGLAGCHGGRGCGHGLFGRNPCPPAVIYGTGPAGPFNPCCYDSYVNH